MEEALLEEQFARSRMTRGLLGKLGRYLKPYRSVVLLNLFLTLLATASQLLGPKLIQIGIDRYLVDFTSEEAAAHGILIVSGLYLTNLLIGWGVSVAQVKSAVWVGQRAINALRIDVFRHVQRLSLNYFDQTHQGRIMNRVGTDIDSLDRVMTWGAAQLLGSLMTLAGVMILMVKYNWRLFFAVSLVIPALGIATHLFHRYGMQAYRRLRIQTSRLMAATAENVSGVRVVQAFAREQENSRRFAELHDVHSARFVDAARIFHTYMPAVGFLSGMGSLIILGYGGHLAMQHRVTVGELAAFLLYLGMFFGPVQTMGDLYNVVLSSAASAERVFELLETPPQVQDRPSAKALATMEGGVTFENVWFRYDSTPEDRWVLRDVSFQARAGQTIALVGATGSGKSSIISLIARFYEAQKGRILIDGVEVRETQLDSLHHHIGIVTQDNFLFTGSVMENLKFARPNASDDDVRQAAIRLGTDDLLTGLPEGYATKVAERGANFSAGERQLICLTRAMVAEPEILILDEATSAIDPKTERRIQLALETLLARRTSFVIAHRLSTIRHADLILVLNQGEVVERGQHADLIEANGHYARLHREFLRVGE